MGTRSQREAGRGTIISDPVTRSGRDTQPCGHPSASQTSRHSPCSAAPFLSQRQAPSPLHTQPHTLPHTHTYSHTNTHNLPRYSNTPHTSSYITHTLLTYSTHTHTYTLHTLTHSSHPHTRKYINSSHTHTHSHTPHTLTHTHSSYSHIHTPSHTPHLHTYTHTQAQSLQEHRQETRGPRGDAHTLGTWSMWEQPRVPAELSRWTFHTLGATGTPRSSLRTRETAEGTQADPARSRPSLTAL